MKSTISILCCLLAVMSSCSCSKTDDGISTNTTEEESPKIISFADRTGDVLSITTTGNRSQDLSYSQLSFSDKDNLSPATIKVDGSTRYQRMDGFGAAITGSTAFNLLKMSETDRKRFLTETFSPSQGYGFSYVRIAIGCSDFSLDEFSCCDQPGLENFSLTSDDKSYIIPILKEILALNPELKVIGSPWTCPMWMKVKDLKSLAPLDSWTSGHLNPKYYEEYGEYFSLWIKAMEAEGISIYAVTPQNEPLNRGNSASLYMSWEEQAKFVKTGLGPALRKSAPDVKIYAFDHNYNYDNISSERSYPTKIYMDSEASAYLTGAAFHNYGGDKEELNRVHAANPDKELIFTETSIGEWNNGRDLSQRLVEDMEQVSLGTINNWSKAVIVWNLMLDKNKGPYRPGGCGTCYGAVDIASDGYSYSSISKNSHYYIIAHLSSVVKPGAYRIKSEGFSEDGLTYTAFSNPDGSYAFVVSNSSARSVPIVLDDGNHHFSTTVPSNAVISLRWK